MKTTATRFAARAALVFAAQLALTACGDDDVDAQPKDDAGSGGDTSADATETKGGSSSGDGDAGMTDGGGSTDPGTSSGDSGSMSGESSGETTSQSGTTPPDAGTGSSVPDGGDDSGAPMDGGPGSGTEVDAGPDGAVVSCYGDEQPSNIDCQAYPFECDGPPHAADACFGMEFMNKAELFQAVFECYDEKQIEDHCSEESLAALEACQDQLMPQACVGEIPACETLALECTDMTAEDCEQIAAPYSTLWLDVAASLETGDSCFSAAVVGNGAGCGERLANCLTGI